MERFTPVRIPKIAQTFAPGLTWHLPNSEKVIYLTFDDGPTAEITPWVLDQLKTYNAKATFFCIGKNVKQHPEIYQRIRSEKHSVGNHTFDHLKGWKVSSKRYLENTLKASEVIPSKLFRPPYGKISPKQVLDLKKHNYHIIMWTVLAMDWSAQVSREECAANVIDKTQSGDIVVFHDSQKAFDNLKYALLKVLDYFSERGFEFKCIPEQYQ